MPLLTEQEIEDVAIFIMNKDTFDMKTLGLDFARAIEAAVIKKIKAQGPSCWLTPDGEGWRLRFEPPVTDTPLGWYALYKLPEGD